MRVFIGCYTKKIADEIVGKGAGIYCFDFDPNTGLLKLEEVISALNPSYLALSKNGEFLYTIEELQIEEGPKIKAFKINSDKTKRLLNLINEQELPGSFACHLAVSNSQQHIIVGSYMSGNVLVYPKNHDGSLLPSTQNIQHMGTGPNLTRQEAAHAHMIYPYGTHGLYVVDLGIDKAKYYRLQDTSHQLIADTEMDIAVNPGAGARHMVMHPSGLYAFIFSELTSELFSYEFKKDSFELMEVIPTLPPDFQSIPSGAAIRIHPNGKYIYVSNRGHDSIGIFSFDEATKKLMELSREPSHGKTPREFNIDPSGQWLIVANQDSDNLVVFKIDQETGLLNKHAINHQVKTPSCILFLEH